MRRDVTRLAMLTAAGLMVSYLESLLPSIGIPGVKLGLANIATVLALYLMDWKRAGAVLIARVLLANFLFGSLSAALYALSGGALALAFMALAKATKKFSVVGASVAGGFSHNMGQLIAAALVAQTPGLLYYVPTLAIAGALTGALVGVLSAQVLKKLG